ncbi:hypothetical protein LTR09_009827 [Extremus antarcticus]|uniref:Uncharacterized protein n=1 Tax=Extremus antarcticus TaxID=702011 RepID=A0AAJ0D8I6_9PEZI|nr:hypothetical protein LTR09_009827 [Extremus antarcticus]
MLDDFKTELGRLSVRFTSQHMDSISHPAGYKRDAELAYGAATEKGILDHLNTDAAEAKATLEQTTALEFLTIAPAAVSDEKSDRGADSVLNSSQDPRKGEVEPLQIEQVS